MKITMRLDKREPLFIEHEDGSLTISRRGVFDLALVMILSWVLCLSVGFVIGFILG